MPMCQQTWGNSWATFRRDLSQGKRVVLLANNGCEMSNFIWDNSKYIIVLRCIQRLASFSGSVVWFRSLERCSGGVSRNELGILATLSEKVAT